MPSDVLVVEDDTTLRRVIAEVLTEEGFTVATAADGCEALTQIVAAPPAVVLLDLHLPLLDGPSVARWLRERDLAVPLVVITADWTGGRVAAEIGARSWLLKPFDIETLLDAVTPHLPPARPLPDATAIEPQPPRCR